MFVGVGWVPDGVTDDLVVFSPDDEMGWISLDDAFFNIAELPEFYVSESECFEVVVEFVECLVVSLELF